MAHANPGITGLGLDPHPFSTTGGSTRPAPAADGYRCLFAPMATLHVSPLGQRRYCMEWCGGPRRPWRCRQDLSYLNSLLAFDETTGLWEELRRLVNRAIIQLFKRRWSASQPIYDAGTTPATSSLYGGRRP